MYAKHLKHGRIVGRRGDNRVQKIPTLFIDEHRGEGRRATGVVRAGFEWVMRGKGIATEKVDGVPCAIIKGRLWKRIITCSRKCLEEPPNGIPCQQFPDKKTGQMPWWVPVTDTPENKWLIEAYLNTPWNREDGTYEAVGLHFNKNPYGLDADFLEAHGRIRVPDFPRDFDGMREYFRTHEIEGIVFWNGGEPRCKVKRIEFGFDWGTKKRLEETTERILEK